jgi:hypothetical protein
MANRRNSKSLNLPSLRVEPDSPSITKLGVERLVINSKLSAAVLKDLTAHSKRAVSWSSFGRSLDASD